MKHVFKSDSYNCKHCGQDGRFKVTTQCPEGKLCDDILKRVQSGQLDLVDGVWVRLKPEQEEAIPKDTVGDSLSSLVEFMIAMGSELSPETSDELTDEDIDLLKNINSVPLPSHVVSSLELPVDLLVSLHKLKRLGYVNLFGGSHDQVSKYYYKSTNKGNKLLDSLKPKPVKLDIHALHLMVLMYKASTLRTPADTKRRATLDWLTGNTRFVYPDCNNIDHWTLTPLGKEFIDDILNKQLLFI